MSTLKISYEEIAIEDVVRYFVKGYGPPPAIEHYDWWLDPAKGKIILRLYAPEAQPPETKP